jgi:hypothetical protein
MGSLLIREEEADCTSRRSQVEDNRRTRACGRRDGERVEEDERRHREEQGVALSLALTGHCCSSLGPPTRQRERPCS